MADNKIVVTLLLNGQQYFADLQKAGMMTSDFAKKVGDGSKSANDMTRELDSLSKSGNSLWSSMLNGAKTAATLAVRFSAMYVAVGALKSTVAAGIDEFVKLDTNLRNIQSITLESDAAIDKLRKTLIGTVLSGNSFGRSASELADGMYELVSAGYSTDEALKIVKIAAEGASAGLSNTGTASKLLLGILQAYHRPAEDAKNAMDELFTIVDLGVIHFDDLATNMGYVIPTAAALKIPLNEVGAAIELLTREGQQPSRVMTNLNAVMSKMLKPTHGLAQEFNKMNFESGEAAVKTLGFAEVIRRLAVEANGSDSKLAAWFGDIRAIRAILPLAANDGEDFINMLALHNEEMAKGSRTDLAFAEQQKSISYQWSEMSAKLRDVVALVGTELTPPLVDLLKHINSGIQSFTDFTGSVTGSANAMLVLKGIIFALVVGEALPRMLGLVTSLATAFLNAEVGQRLAYAATGHFATALAGLNLTMPIVLIALAALYIGLRKLADMSDISVMIKAQKGHLDELTEAINKAREASSKGIMSPNAFNLFAEQKTLSTMKDIIEDMRVAMENLNDGNLKKGLTDFAGFLWRGATSLGSDIRSNVQVMRDETKKMLDAAVKTAGMDVKTLQALSDEMRKVIAAKQAENKQFEDDVKNRQGLTSNQKKNLQDQIFANNEVVKALQEGDNATQHQLQAAVTLAAQHRAVAIAAHQTTEEIETANARLDGVNDNVKAWASNLAPLQKAFKDINGLMTPQKAARDANIAGLEAEIAKYEMEHKVVKDANKTIIEGLEKEKLARKTALDVTEASITKQKQLIEQHKLGLEVFDKQIEKLEKAKEALTDKSGGLSQELQDQMQLLEDQKQILEDQKRDTSQIDKQIEELKKRINLEKLGSDTKAIADRKASLAIDKQIKDVKDQKKAKEDAIKAEEEALKKRENAYQNEKDRVKLLDDKTNARLEDLKEIDKLGDPILNNMKEQLKTAQGIADFEEKRAKALEARSILEVSKKLNEQGFLPTEAELNFLREAYPAIMDKDMAKVQQIADKWGVSGDRVKTMMEQATAFSQKDFTPKIDNDKFKVAPKVDSTQIDALLAKIKKIQDSVVDPLTLYINEVMNLNNGTGHWDTNATGGLITKHTFSELAEGDKPEMVLPLTDLKRSSQLLGQLSPNALKSMWPAGAMGGGYNNGNSTTNRLFNNYGSVTFDNRAGAHTTDTDIMLQRFVV